MGSLCIVIFFVCKHLDIFRGVICARNADFPHCYEHVHGGIGAKDHPHSTRGLPTKKLEEIHGRRLLPGSHRQGREIARTVDPISSIVFTREDEGNNSMPFLDANSTRKINGSVKSTVYRKKTHTDQYVHFASHHPKHQKLGFVRTFMNRCETITAEETEEMEHLRGALRVYGYTSMVLKNVTDKTKGKKIPIVGQRHQESSGYSVCGVSERVHRVMKNTELQQPYVPTPVTPPSDACWYIHKTR